MAISTWASSSGARRRSVVGGSSLDGTHEGWSSASLIDAAAVGDVALGEQHACESRLGIPSGLVGGQEGLFGAGDVAAVQPDAAEFAESASPSSRRR